MSWLFRIASSIGMSVSVVRILLIAIAALGGSALLYKAWGFVTQRELVQQLEAENLTLDQRWSDEHTALLNSKAAVDNLQIVLEDERKKKEHMEFVHHRRDEKNIANAELLKKVQDEVAELAKTNLDVEAWLACEAPIEIICQTLKVMGEANEACDD